jgi:hypothetical protein
VRSTIFIQIAAYRDPDLPATLHHLIERAAQPERLRFGICLQLADNDPAHWGESAFPNHPHLKIVRFDATESHGACWARRQAQSFYGGENFLLQIDSHMRAVEHWDDLLLTTWRECSDERAVLSVYPNGFQQPCRLQTSTLPVMGAAGFDDYGILKLRGISRFQLPEEQPERPIPGAFIAGGFLFGPGSIVSEVPYDPELYFYGEEIAMSARLWTSGFNIYAPNRLLLFHLYKSEATAAEHSTTHWGDHSNWFELNRRSLLRVHTLLKSLKHAPEQLKLLNNDVNNIDSYPLGDQRSLHDYQLWAGVNFSMQEISKNARHAHFNKTSD